jgi:hypothetical protein
VATHLDGAGLAKMATLDEAVTLLQRLHAIVERMAAAVRSQQDTTMHKQQIQRAAAPLVTLLRPQYEPMAAHVSDMLLIATRGGGEQMKVRALREGVAQLRAQIDVAIRRVHEHHSVEREPEKE